MPLHLLGGARFANAYYLGNLLVLASYFPLRVALAEPAAVTGVHAKLLNYVRASLRLRRVFCVLRECVCAEACALARCARAGAPGGAHDPRLARHQGAMRLRLRTQTQRGATRCVRRRTVAP
jgi:hypothetical protein